MKHVYSEINFICVGIWLKIDYNKFSASVYVLLLSSKTAEGIVL